MHFALFGLEALDISTLSIQLFVLLILELFKFEFIPFTLTFFDSFADTFVTATKGKLFSLQLLVELSFKIC